jgi:hypothetical protein
VQRQVVVKQQMTFTGLGVTRGVTGLIVQRGIRRAEDVIPLESRALSEHAVRAKPGPVGTDVGSLVVRVGKLTVTDDDFRPGEVQGLARMARDQCAP